MISGSLARRYARAFVQLGDKAGTHEQLGRELRSLAGAMKVSRELEETLSNPAFPRADRRRILQAILQRIGASHDTTVFVMLLLDGERVAVLPAISREVDAMLDARAGRVKAEVVSAQPLTPAQTTQIKTSLEQLSGRSVQLQTKEDPALLGGVVAKVGDVVYDGSVRTQLRRLRESIVR